MAWEDDTKILLRSPYLLHTTALGMFVFMLQAWGIEKIKELFGEQK